MTTTSLIRYFLAFLESLDVTPIFLVPGATLDPLVQALAEDQSLKAVCCSHEVSAGYMADGYSRVTGKPGIMAVMGGPGASHAMTALLTVKTEQIPLLLVTGDVDSKLADLHAFQNPGPALLNQSAWLEPLMLKSWRIQDPAEAPKILAQAQTCLKAWPAGPLHLQIPVDLWEKPLEADLPALKLTITETPPLSPERIRQLGDKLKSSVKCALWVGSSLKASLAAPQLESLANSLQIPVITSLCAKGLLPENHPLSIGVFGFGGNDRAEQLLLSEELETLVVLGVRPSERNTLSWHADLLTGKRSILWVDQTTQPQWAKAFPQLEVISANPNAILEALATQIPPLPESLRAQRLAWLKFIKERPAKLQPPERETLATYFKLLRQAIEPTAPVFVDAGLVKRNAGSLWQALQPDTFYISSEVGAMGWAIGAGIGAAFAQQKPVVVLTGDGSMRMQGTEISTAALHRLPILFVVFKNGTLGSVAQRLAESPSSQSLLQLPPIQWTVFAKSLGVPAQQVNSPADLANILAEKQVLKGPFLIEILLPISDSQAPERAIPGLERPEHPGYLSRPSEQDL